MNREIKFRLRIDDEIIGHEEWTPEGWVYEPVGGVRTYMYIYHTAKDQFIGYPDKKGKDIYDRDIVRRIVGEETKNYIICWGTWSWVKRSKPDSPAFIFDAIDARSNCEIIGNVFQNKDLLEQK